MLKKPIQLYTEPYPACPHLCGKTCVALSDEIGRQAPVTNAFCNKICKVTGINDPTMRETLISAALSTWKAKHGSETFLQRVIGSYQDLRPVSVPQWWADAKSELAPLYAFPFVTSINLSGSAIYGEKPEKDIDLIIQVRSFVEVTDDFYAAVPQTLLGKKVDAFVRREWYGAFPQLDCERKILHVPIATFPMQGRTVEAGITVQFHDDPTFAGFKPSREEPKPAAVSAPQPQVKLHPPKAQEQIDEIRRQRMSGSRGGKGCGCSKAKTA